MNTKLENDKVKLEGEITRQNHRIASLEDDNRELADTCARCKEEISSLNATIAELRRNLRDLEIQLEDKIAEIGGL